MKLKNQFLGAAILAAIVATSAPGWAAERETQTQGKEKSKKYPLTTCVVSGEKLGSMGDAHVHQHKGREVQFCCKGCLKDFNRDPAKYLQKIDKAEGKAAGLKPYALTTCLVSDEKLGEMGEPYVHTYKDRQVKLCCEGCLKDFNREPAKYMQKLEAAEKRAGIKS